MRLALFGQHLEPTCWVRDHHNAGFALRDDSIVTPFE